MSALFGEKNFGFFEIYSVSARTREVELVRIFCRQKEEGVTFSRFCADVCYGRHLTILISLKRPPNFFLKHSVAFFECVA